MTTFASPADLQLLDPSLSDDMADLVLEMVCDGIRAGVQWQVDEFTGTKTFTPARGETVTSMCLPGRNVTDVTVTINTIVQDATTDYTVDQGAGTVTLTTPSCDPVTVDYTAGWTAATRPGVFRTVALEWALQYAANPANVRQYTIGKVQETFAGTGSSALVIEDPRLDTYSLGYGF